jgi:hypothetical protein
LNTLLLKLLKALNDIITQVTTLLSFPSSFPYPLFCLEFDLIEKGCRRLKREILNLIGAVGRVVITVIKHGNKWSFDLLDVDSEIRRLLYSPFVMY